MTVKELKEELQGLDDNIEIMLQIDAEGNGYCKVRGADPKNIYDEQTGTVYSLGWTAQEACMEDDEWKELIDNNPIVLIIYP